VRPRGARERWRVARKRRQQACAAALLQALLLAKLL
jgi:hypothetical protein